MVVPGPRLLLRWGSALPWALAVLAADEDGSVWGCGGSPEDFYGPGLEGRTSFPLTFHCQRSVHAKLQGSLEM